MYFIMYFKSYMINRRFNVTALFTIKVINCGIGVFQNVHRHFNSLKIYRVNGFNFNNPKS